MLSKLLKGTAYPSRLEYLFPAIIDILYTTIVAIVIRLLTFMKNYYLVALMALLSVALAGCGKSESELRTEVLQGKIARLLTDPGSAQFRNLKLSADGKYLCGEINAKNRMGGYVGFELFAVGDKLEYIDPTEGPKAKFFLGPYGTKYENDMVKELRASGCFA